MKWAISALLFLLAGLIFLAFSGCAKQPDDSQLWRVVQQGMKR